MSSLQKLIIKTGSTLPAVKDQMGGDFEDWILREFPESDRQAWQVIHVEAGEALPDPAQCAGVVVTGSRCMVTDRADWSVRTAVWLKALHQQNTPILGICYGHQLVAEALGGEVGFHPQGPEIGTVSIATNVHEVQDDPLFSHLPPRFAANVIHWQTVKTLPKGATVLAYNAFEPHQAFRLGRTWGVQFHPEFNQTVMSTYLEQLGPRLEQEGLDLNYLKAHVEPTPFAASLLQHFTRLLDE